MTEIYLSSQEEVWRKRTVSIAGIFLILAFFMPMMSEKELVFPNVAGLEHADFGLAVFLLYPLLAGILVLAVGLSGQGLARSITILIAGFFPFFWIFVSVNSFRRASGGYSNSGPEEPTLIFLVFFILSLIGMFAGARILKFRNHISGRVIGGISGITFILLVLLPILVKKPIFFRLFGLQNNFSEMGGYLTSDVRSLVTFNTIMVIIIFLAFLTAAILSIVSLSIETGAPKVTSATTSLIFYGALALPILILLNLFILTNNEEAIGAALMIVVRSFLTTAGAFALIPLGLVDLVCQMVVPEALIPQPDISLTERFQENVPKQAHVSSVQFYSGEYAGNTLPLSFHQALIIGRDPLKANVVLSHRKVSRAHVLVKFDPVQDRFLIQDLESAHGVYVNGGKLPKGGDTYVGTGARIELGKNLCGFFVWSNSPGQS